MVGRVGRWFWVYRWFMLAVICVILNAIGVGAYLRSGAQGRVQVDLVVPEPDVLSELPEIRWEFSHPMVSGIATGELISADLAQFTPRVDGHFIWLERDVLAFSPESGWPASSEFSVTLDPGLRSLSGDRIEKKWNKRFQTPALQLRGVRQTDFRPGESGRLVLEFSDRVTPVELQDHLTIFDDDGRSVRWRAVGEVDSELVMLRLTELETQGVRLRLTKGLKGVSGPLALEEDVERSITFSGELRVSEVEAFLNTSTAGVVESLIYLLTLRI